MTQATAQDVRYVTDIVERSGSSFTAGMKFLPPEKRQYLFAIYAYCRVLDDSADSTTLSLSEKENRIQDWEDKIKGLEQGHAPCPITRLLSDAIKRHDLPIHELYRVIEGMRFDLTDSVRVASWDVLYDYCRNVAVSVGLLTLAIFDRHDSEAKQFGENVGYALQLTNILRDVHEDWQMGRCYIPQALASQHGIPLSPEGPTLKPLLTQIATKAEAHYQAAHTALETINRDNLGTACIMMTAYEALFQKIKKRGLDVLTPRVSLSPIEKAALLAKSVRYLS